jgi:rubrerythrin
MNFREALLGDYVLKQQRADSGEFWRKFIELSQLRGEQLHRLAGLARVPAGKTVALWDCAYCGGINVSAASGYCPNCGAPREQR